MNEKLNYLEMLKNNVGEEMAEMMSDEITKVMDEQRSIEMEYARLVQQRDQLKGITNKHRLEETKNEITVSQQQQQSISKTRKKGTVSVTVSIQIWRDNDTTPAV